MKSERTSRNLAWSRGAPLTPISTKVSHEDRDYRRTGLIGSKVVERLPMLTWNVVTGTPQ
jgi:hypothetical protein